MAKHNLSASRENWKLAFDTLNSAGVMLNGPAPVVPVVEEPVAIPVIEPVVPVEEPAQEFTRITTTLTRDNASDVGTVRTVGNDIVYVIEGRIDQKTKAKLTADRTVYGMEALDIMPSDVYKHRIQHEPNFAKKVNALYKEQEKTAVAKAQAQANG